MLDSPKMFAICGICAVWGAVGLLGPVNGQIGARNSIPETISMCYRNYTAYNRYTRQPMHINNLIAIIRKIEQKESAWTMRRIARILVHRYTFDGLEYEGELKPELQFSPVAEEAHKTELIKSLIPIQTDEYLPQGVLDNDELCALHWMLSHSMNATVREEEINPYGYNSGYNTGTGTGYNTGNGYNPGSGYNGNGNSGGYDNMRRGRRSVAVNPGEQIFDQDHEQYSDDNTGGEEKNSGEESPPLRSIENVEDEPNKSQNVDQQEAANVDSVNSNEIPSANQAGGNLGRSIDALQSDTDTDAAKFARQVSTIDPTKSRRPIETGVVYTSWGSISAGRLIAGIAAGLELENYPSGGSPYPNPNTGSGSNTGYNGFGSGSNNPYGTVPNANNNNNNPFSPGSSNNGGNNAPQRYPPPGRKRRQAVYPPPQLQQLNPLHAATLAGDVGQAAIRNGRYQAQSAPMPRGIWNDTICPREYVLEPYPGSDREIYMERAAFTYLTEAEVRGGMDGLILGKNIRNWDFKGFKLSQILEMYYSEEGITGEASYRSCNRRSLYSIYEGEVREQARTFAYLYNNRTITIPIQEINQNPNNALFAPVDQAMSKASSIQSDPSCKRPAGSNINDDSLKFTEIKTRMYVVLDHTATFDEIVAQKRFIAQLGYEINVSPKGSRLGVIDGNSGQILISPNHTDTSPILACMILALPTQIKSQDIVRVLTNLKTELEKLRAEEQRLNFEPSDLSISVLFLVQGNKLEDGQKSEFNRLLQELNNLYGDVKILFTSSKYTQNDFNGFALNPERDFLRIQATQNLSDSADEFATEIRTKAPHGRLPYIKCNANIYPQDEEHKVATTKFIPSNNLQYFKISPDYFHSAKSLRLRFTSDNGKVRICQSRDEEFPSSKNAGSSGTSCTETKGLNVIPGSNTEDVQFTYNKPCGKHGKRNGCKPIYISVTPIEVTPSVGYNCVGDECTPPNTVKVVFTHWDMRCCGYRLNAGSSAFLFIIVALRFLNIL